MNFLAHIYLSGDPSPLMIGNFIADYVKGKQKERFSPEIQQGIQLHRKINEKNSFYTFCFCSIISLKCFVIIKKVQSCPP